MPLFGPKKPRVLGIDIGTASIKAVLLTAADGTFQLETFETASLSASFVRSRDAQYEKTVSDTLKTLLGQLKLRPRDLKRVVVGVPGLLAFTTVVTLPTAPADQLAAALAAEAGKYVPADISTVSLSWTPVATYQDVAGASVTDIFLIAIPQEILASYQRMFAAAGLSAPIVELSAAALARAVVGSDPTATLLADIGSDQTELSLVENGVLRFNRSINTGGRAMTEKLMETLSYTAQLAEEQKREIGLDRDRVVDPVPRSIQVIVDVIADELDRIRVAYQRRTRRDVERVIVSGGGAHVRDIDYYLGRKLRLPVFLAAPWTRVHYDPRQQSAVLAAGSDVATALGLAMYPYA